MWVEPAAELSAPVGAVSGRARLLLTLDLAGGQLQQLTPTEGGPLAGGYTEAAAATLDKANLAQTAFGVVFGEDLGAMFVAVCLFFFAFSTILGWNLFGKINMIYLFGKKSVVIYTVVALVFIFLGTVMSNDLVWELTDMFNNLMVIPNAIALFALSGMVVKSLRRDGAKEKLRK